MSEPTPTIPDVVTLDVPAGSRVLVASDLHLGWRADADTLAVTQELATALEGTAGPGVLVLAGDTFALLDDSQCDPGRIIDVHPRFAAALERFAAGADRTVVVLVGHHDAALGDNDKARAALERRFHALVARVAELTICTGAGERKVRVEPGSRFDLVNDAPRAEADRLRAAGYFGFITGHTHQPELSSLRGGFYANTGTSGAVTVHRPARFGLAPVEVGERHVTWVEMEAGADLHVRLLHGRVDLPGASLRTRLVARSGPDPIPRAAVVASFPGGEDWPERVYEDGRRRRTRRTAGAIIAIAGLVNLLSSLTPPLRDRLEILRDFVPVTVNETASALVAATGIGLLLLARGVRRGQRHAWMLAVGLTGLTAVLHVVKGLDIEETIAALVILAYLLRKRRDFTVAADVPSVNRALLTLAGGGVAVVLIGTITALWIPDRSGMPVGRAIAAVGERLVGVDSISIPSRRDRFLTPSLAGAGLALGLMAGWLVFRPVTRGRRGSDRDLARAREVVAAHGGDTLAYFALRDDKQHFFWQGSLVTYAVHNGVCLVSPDPIGPAAEQAGAWRAFRDFADAHGWSVAVMAAGEEWLPTYHASGMRDLYVGDEAIVDVSRFSLEGGRNKGLRQAVNRIAKHGYSLELFDPAHLDPKLEAKLRGLMTESRRGELERGFSMTLGRVFSSDDAGLLLAVCFGPDGEPAAFCQYVPAPDINGYSLDLMRRSETDEHPNGLTDFVVVRTIEHLRDRGMHGLGLNFAVMRSVLACEDGDRGIGSRLHRLVLGWLSESMQIESLWKYNAKFDPDWRPRYAVYDAAGSFLPSAIAVAKAESFWELPLIGRFFEPDAPDAPDASGDVAVTTGRPVSS
jgi:lysylphosphatidylglycerol synthetase-like protein (DUF2156 family)/UDP-2,3-diacylglucosamine pyrophosphatase LpxH